MRKIIQLMETANHKFIALCDDGTLWLLSSDYDDLPKWVIFPPIPQEE